MRKFFRKQDIIVISIILLVAVAGILYPIINRINSGEPPATNLYGEIEIDGKIITSFSLSGSGILDIKGHPEVQFEIKDNGTVGFVYADCPDQLCVKKGFIGKVGQNAVCLPNKTILRIISDNPADSGGVDITA